jgi:hypothetical protein
MEKKKKKEPMPRLANMVELHVLPYPNKPRVLEIQHILK